MRTGRPIPPSTLTDNKRHVMRVRLGDAGDSECPACGEVTQTRRLGEKHAHVLWECRRCRAVFPGPESLGVETRDLYE
jgi:ribosomal protein L37AE/L43A